MLELVINSILTVIILFGSWQLKRSTALLRQQSIELHQEMAATIQFVAKKLETAQESREEAELVKQAVNTGVNSMESLHKTLSGLTFGFLESVTTPETTEAMKKLHARTSETFFDTVRAISSPEKPVKPKKPS
ncbi:MAG: hypothetical protein HQM12_08445 [SAR324 cluster bacterium]|nr:hypothetical protein [SAR324 cluster bacterium]